MRYIVLAVMLLLIPGAAHAGNCSNPTRPEGDITYNATAHIPEFCNGTYWVSMYAGGPGAAGGGSACSAPSGLSFTALTGQSLATLITSNTATITFTECSVAQAVSVTGAATAQISVNGAAWATSGAISSGQTLQVRLTSSNTANTMQTATVTVGSSSASWHVTTKTGALKVFLSANTYVGDTIGSLSAADVLCQSEAGTAGYAGTYKAIMSDNSTSAASRLTLSYPIVNAYDGSTVSAANLWSCCLSAQILPPSGSAANQTVWTGTGDTGAIQTGNTCSSWANTGLGFEGESNNLVGAWIAWTTNNCVFGKHLYCIQQ